MQPVRTVPFFNLRWVSLGVVRCHLGGPEGGTRYCGWATPPHFFRGAGIAPWGVLDDSRHFAPGEMFTVVEEHVFPYLDPAGP